MSILSSPTSGRFHLKPLMGRFFVRPWSRPALFVPTLLLLSIASANRIVLATDIDVMRFEKTVVQSDLVQPMELAIAPDGRIFIIELGGTVKLLEPMTGKVTEAAKLNVTTAQENGLIGLTLDPNFAENGWVYLQYSPPEFSGQYVSRFDFRDERLDLESEKILLKYDEQRRECCHHAGSLEFGPDGCLYIGTGDNTNPFNDSQGYAPLDQRKDREPWDAQRTSANTKNYNGKILRIKPEPNGTYSIPDGNLFPQDGSIGHPEIYVMGCRNPWRISVDQKTGFLYWGDVGPDAGSEGQRGPRGYDEVNQARTAGNFGWPYFIGDNFAYSLVDFESGEISESQDPATPINKSINNTGARELPAAQPAMIYYPAAASEKFPEVFSGGRTACAGPVYYFDESLDSQTKFPSQYDRTLFAYEWSRNWILAVHLDQESNIQSLEPFLPHMTFVRPIDLQFDSLGALYVIEYGETWGVNPDAKLVRIDYVRGNRKPEAIATAENSVGREPLTVQFSASESRDRDGDTLRYRWSYQLASNDPSQNTDKEALSDAAVFEHQFTRPGVYTVQLEVADSSGAVASTSLPVIVGNARPQVEIISPRDGEFYDPSRPMEYEVLVRDVEDGTNDFDLAEEDGWHLVESHAPSRTFVQVVSTGKQQGPENVPPGLALIRNSDCFNCHAESRKLVGPSFLEIADKYRDNPHQMEKSVQRVIQGSTGVWGKIGMLPHQQHSEADVLQMVQYVYSVTADASHPTAQGFRNSIDLPESVAGDIQLEASYTDLGRDEIPRLVGNATISLRNPKIQAELADEFQGCRKLGSESAEGKNFIGAIEHDGFLKIKQVHLNEVTGMTVRVTSAGVGGAIEVRQGSADGLVLGSVNIEVNGSWDAYYEKRIELPNTPERQDVADVYVVFKNEKNRGGLMNIDSLSFEK